MGGRRGTVVRLRYVHRFVDRHGKVRFYFRRHGKRTPLQGQPEDPAFIEAYQRSLQSAGSIPAPSRRPEHPQGSVGALITLYKTSLGFKRNMPRTQHVTRLILDRFATNHGPRLVRQMKRVHVEKILADMADTPAAANDLLKKLRRLMDYACEQGWRSDNPCTGIKPFKEGTHHTWTDQQLDAFEEAWPLGTKERTAYCLHLYTAQRSQDVRQMTWAAIHGDLIHVVQGKTAEKLSIPMHPDLQRALAAYPRLHHVIIPTALGRPFTEKGYGQWMAKAIHQAGLSPECVTHGLRKAGARRLAESGATAKEIAAITGHRTLKEVARYTADADQATLARAAIARLPERNQKEIGKPDGEVCQPARKCK